MSKRQAGGRSCHEIVTIAVAVLQRCGLEPNEGDVAKLKQEVTERLRGIEGLT